MRGQIPEENAVKLQGSQSSNNFRKVWKNKYCVIKKASLFITMVNAIKNLSGQ